MCNKSSRLLLACLWAATVQAFEPGPAKQELACTPRNHRRMASHCEMRETNLTAAAALRVDGRPNGGVRIQGWDSPGILVRAKVEGWDETEAGARRLVSAVRVETGGGQVRAEGPTSESRSYWSVSFEVFVPRATPLRADSVNGGITLADTTGGAEFEAVNGGVTLKRLSGNVKGRTVNGGITIELDGDRWTGEGLDVSTTNGGVQMRMPENYSAHLEASTANGRVSAGFPVTLQGKIENRLATTLGSGGATIRAVTRNGGVSINRAR